MSDEEIFITYKTTLNKLVEDYSYFEILDFARGYEIEFHLRFSIFIAHLYVAIADIQNKKINKYYL